MRPKNYISFITGHCLLNRHRHLMSQVPLPQCRYCPEEEETPEHLLMNCPATAVARMQLQRNWKPQSTLLFLAAINTTFTLNEQR
jgi:hypothetical protein